MKHKRTSDKWHDIFEQQKSSGLNIKTFCRQHKIATSNFYKHRKTMTEVPLPEFVKVNVEANETVTQLMASPIVLITSAGELQFPTSINMQLLIDVIKGLSQ